MPCVSFDLQYKGLDVTQWLASGHGSFEKGSVKANFRNRIMNTMKAWQKTPIEWYKISVEERASMVAHQFANDLVATMDAHDKEEERKRARKK